MMYSSTRNRLLLSVSDLFFVPLSPILFPIGFVRGVMDTAYNESGKVDLRIKPDDTLIGYITDSLFFDAGYGLVQPRRVARHYKSLLGIK